MIHGPPGVGKTHISQALATHYNVTIINGHKIAQDHFDNLVLLLTRDI
jgi:broad-specificity NMP kinase